MLKIIFHSKICCDLEIRRIGPCSIAALKSGTLDLKWDTPGIYGILHGSKTYWLVYPNGNKRLIGKHLSMLLLTLTSLFFINFYSDNTINIKILTKSLKNDNEYEDITKNYISPKSM
jgi:hypothetical protein